LRRFVRVETDRGARVGSATAGQRRACSTTTTACSIAAARRGSSREFLSARAAAAPPRINDPRSVCAPASQYERSPRARGPSEGGGEGTAPPRRLRVVLRGRAARALMKARKCCARFEGGARSACAATRVDGPRDGARDRARLGRRKPGRGERSGGNDVSSRDIEGRIRSTSRRRRSSPEPRASGLRSQSPPTGTRRGRSDADHDGRRRGALRRRDVDDRWKRTPRGAGEVGGTRQPDPARLGC